jgi:hypothetical protein
MFGIAHRCPLQINTLMNTLSAIIGMFASGDKIDTRRGTPRPESTWFFVLAPVLTSLSHPPAPPEPAEAGRLDRAEQHEANQIAARLACTSSARIPSPTTAHITSVISSGVRVLLVPRSAPA